MAPTDLLWGLVRSVTGRQKKVEPVLNDSTAASISILFTALYVLPFYVSPRTRPSRHLNRDAPSVIQARIRAVTITVTVSTLTTFLLLNFKGRLTVHDSLHHLGFWPIDPLAIVQPFVLTLLLFLGPLYNEIFLQQNLSPVSNLRSKLVTSLASSIGYRNYVAGPITEELLFRSTIIPIHLLSSMQNSPKKLIFLTPLYFGVAHVHHFYEFRLSHPDTPLAPAILRTIFQFGYTTIFGWYASFTFLRTGNFYVVFTIHTFCNYMGLPRLWGKVRLKSHGQRQFGATQIGPMIRGKQDSERDPTASQFSDSHESRRSNNAFMLDPATKHSIVYYSLLLVGVYGFVMCLFPLTNFPNLQLVQIGNNGGESAAFP